MQVKALKSFQGRHGFVRAGQTINLEDSYARDLAKSGLVEPLNGEGDGGPKPQNRQASYRAPVVGSGRPGANEKRPGKEARLGDGPTLTPLSSQAARARPARTQSGSVRGGGKAKSANKKTVTDHNPGDDA